MQYKEEEESLEMRLSDDLNKQSGNKFDVATMTNLENAADYDGRELCSVTPLGASETVRLVYLKSTR